MYSPSAAAFPTSWTTPPLRWSRTSAGTVPDVRRPTPAKRQPPAEVRHDRHRGTTTERRLGGRSSAARARLALLPHEGSAVGMWESRVLGEMSTSLWTPCCGVHRDAMSTVGVPWPNVIDPTSPTRCPEEPFLLDTFPDGVREKFGTLSRARLSAARRPGRARSSAGAPSRRDLPPFVPLRSICDGRKCDATIEA